MAFINSYLGVGDFKDYDGAKNGLQCSNSGKVTAIASAVDAGLGEIKVASHMGADLLIAHHGMFWSPPIPFTGGNYDKIKTLVDSDMAVYACHLPLDAHPQIGNNALIAKALKLRAISSCFEYYGRVRFGSREPKKVAICSGGSGDCVGKLPELGVDTLVCGELSQYHFTVAQELNLNLYPCGHYATERFGVMALGELVAKEFGLTCSFIEMNNPL